MVLDLDSRESPVCGEQEQSAYNGYLGSVCYHLVKYARYYWLLLAAGHLSRRLFGSMLRMTAALPQADG